MTLKAGWHRQPLWCQEGREHGVLDFGKERSTYAPRHKNWLKWMNDFRGQLPGPSEWHVSSLGSGSFGPVCLAQALRIREGEEGGNAT